MVNSVLDYLEESTRKFPDKTAFQDETESMTYRELSAISDCVGAALTGLINPREAVPVYMDKSCMAMALFMGIVKAGGFYILLDQTQPAERLDMIIDTLHARVCFVNDDTKEKVNALAFSGKVLTASEFMKHTVTEAEKAELKRRRSSAIDIDPLYSIFTSGSTGTPKGVVVNHRSVIDFIECFTEIFGITSEDVIGNQAPFDFDVSVKDIYSTLKTGATMQIIPRQYFLLPTKLLDYLDDRKVTTLIWAVSALCIVTTLKGFEYRIPRFIDKVIFSGEVMPIKHLNQWRENYPKAMFVNVYGPTEITCNCMYYIVDRDYKLDETLPMGQAFPNERVFLLDEQDKLIESSAHNKIGEICVSGTAVTLGYYNNKEKTEQAFVQNPLNKAYNEIIYRTGDLGYYNREGMMCFSSRKDFQIKHMGHRIELGEIEMAINAENDVLRACCIYDEEQNKILGFYEGTATKKAITHGLVQKIPKYMIPSEFIRVEKMPITKNGKIDRKALMEEYEERSNGDK